MNRVVYKGFIAILLIAGIKASLAQDADPFANLDAKEPDPFEISDSIPYIFLTVSRSLDGPKISLNRKIFPESEFEQALSELNVPGAVLILESEKGTHQVAEKLKNLAAKAGVEKIRHFPYIQHGQKMDGRLVNVVDPLRSITFPSVEFDETPLRDAIDFIRDRSMQLDMWVMRPEFKGINIILREPTDETVYLSFRQSDITLGELLWLVASQSALEMTIEPEAVVLTPPGENQEAKIWDDMDPDSLEGKLQSRLLKTNLQTIIEFNDTPLPAAIDFLNEKSKIYDPGNNDFKVRIQGDFDNAEPTVTLTLKSISLYYAIIYTCDAVGANFTLSQNEVIITPP